MPSGLFSAFPGLGIQTLLVGCGLMVLWWRRRWTMIKRCAGLTDFTPSMPAVRLPWLSCVTFRTARVRAAWDAHQKSLQVVNGFVIATLRGSIDLFLQSVHLPYQLAPGDRCPVFDWLRCHRFRFFPVTHSSIFHPTVPMSAYPLAFPEAFASSAIPPSDGLRLVACSLDRPPERAM